MQSEHPARVSRSLPPLLAGLMFLWGRAVAQVSSNVYLSVYVDDRTLWSRQQQPWCELERALAATTAIDKAMRFRFSDDKCEMFACGVAPTTRLSDYVDKAGAPMARRWVLQTVGNILQPVQATACSAIG